MSDITTSEVTSEEALEEAIKQQELLEKTGNRVRYSPWQKVEDEYGHHYVVFKIGGLHECYYVVELDNDFLLSKVIGPDKYNIENPKELYFGCDICDGHEEAFSNTNQNGEQETCRHREAVISVLKRIHDFDSITKRRPWKVPYYSDGWVINFTPSKY